MENIRKNIPGIIIAFTIVIITEMMFFGGLISAYIIANSQAIDWPPIDQPRLPVWLSLSNMIILLVSGALMYLYVKKVKNKTSKPAYLTLSILLGIVFIIIQGFEWVNLVNFGLKSWLGLYASYFYSLIAVHGVHVLVGLLLLIVLHFKMSSDKVTENKTNKTRAFGMFWYFVSLLWPVLYFLLYLI